MISTHGPSGRGSAFTATTVYCYYYEGSQEMLIIFQLPMADLRPLANQRVLYPHLPPQSEKEDPDVLRYFGSAGRRRKCGDKAFSDEEGFYSAHNAIRLQGLGKRSFSTADVKVMPEVTSSRQLYIAEKRLPARVEVAIGLRPTEPLTSKGLLSLLRSTLLLKASVLARSPRSTNPSIEVEAEDCEGPLVLKGKAIAAHFARCTSLDNPGALRDAVHLVRKCQPILVVSFDYGELPEKLMEEDLPDFRKLDRGETGGVDVWYGQISAGGRKLTPCWLISPGTAKFNDARKLGICLLRLHAEHRVLDEVLTWHEMAKEPKLDTEKLAQYLRSTWDTVLGRERRSGLDQSALMKAISAATAVRPEAWSIELKDRTAAAMKDLGQQPLSGGYEPQTQVPWQQWLEQLPIATRPDLTVVIDYTPDPTALDWSFLPKDGSIAIPDRPIRKPIGNRPEDMPNLLLNQAALDGKQLPFNIHGIGHTIGACVPAELWNLLRDLETKVEGKPTLLLLTHDPYIPWELATEDINSAFLGALARIGRWPLNRPHAKNALPVPPTRIAVENGSFISGKYSQRNLAAAQKEVRDIIANLEGAGVADPNIAFKPVNADIKTVREQLKDKPNQDRVIHFATHGHFGPVSTTGGLRLTDGTLQHWEVKEFNLKGQPFVFLNACEVGAATNILNNVEGIAESFLVAGAAAVVAPFWAIDDSAAAAIAVAFYKELCDPGDTSLVSEFFRQQRDNFSPAKSSATALAYKFYGHPNLHLQLERDPK